MTDLFKALLKASWRLPTALGIEHKALPAPAWGGGSGGALLPPQPFLWLLRASSAPGDPSVPRTCLGVLLVLEILSGRLTPRSQRSSDARTKFCPSDLQTPAAHTSLPEHFCCYYKSASKECCQDEATADIRSIHQMLTFYLLSVALLSPSCIVSSGGQNTPVVFLPQ